MRRARRILERQGLHLLALTLLLAGVRAAAEVPGFAAGSVAGAPTVTWVVVHLAVTVAHQVLVWASWRPQLHGELWTRLLGAAAFPLHAAAFTVLGLGRVASICAVALANAGTLGVAPWLAQTLALLLVPPVLYLFVSVGRWFGFRRAMGLDHYDPATRALPLVREGIFRWSGNAMYTFGFLLLWIPGLWWGSLAALVCAAFGHAYIWVHYATTEAPDLRAMYGGRGTG